MDFNFDEFIDRHEQNSIKWGYPKTLFGDDPILPMWVADMDFANPPLILNELKKLLDQRILGYTFPPDTLYQAIINWQEEHHNFALTAHDILFSPGVVPSIALLIQTFTKEQDAVMIHDPVYNPFETMVTLNNRRVVRSSLINIDGLFRMDFKDIEQQFIHENIKLFILSNPQNPGGRVWTKQELIQLADLCQKHQVLLCSDEIHGDLVYQPERFFPVAAINEAYKEFVITLTAATKTFNLAGTKNSMIFVQNETLRSALVLAQAKTEQNSINTFGYAATEAAFTTGGPWLKELLAYLKINLDTICTFFDTKLPEVSYMKPQGTYLFWFDCSTIGIPDESLTDHFAKVGKIGLNAGSAYGPAGAQYMRLNFAAPHAVVVDGLDRIKYAFDHPTG
ncbi:MalY/PatB family protein [Carnobacterium sp. ISL-102]|uniref:MalY/PatB family protein n=1 Tax=Carnobacterium sp. ISL-102 TaxID=2819142 RepID=UPI001BE8EFE2|nr:MalY/PatB family protein [Carnobacterium sp. ISL-102]MBT2731975.1 pyridoxal phosphate-dependent aminotransferase [Carnobacterium sp. ISL-102]